MTELSIKQTLEAGINAYNVGALDEAHRIYSIILAKYPMQPDANHNLGIIELSRGHNDKAIELFRKAIDVEGDVEQHWLSCIGALINSDNLSEARSLLSKVRKKNIDFANFKDLENAMLSKVNANISSNLDTIIEHAIWFKDLGKTSDAVCLLTEALRYHGSNIECLCLLTNCHIVEGNLDKARYYIDQCKLINENDINIMYSEARLLLRSNKFSDALEVAIEAYQRRPENEESLGILGTAYRLNNHIDRSLFFLDKALFKNPNYAEGLINRGFAHLAIGNTSKAIEDLQRAFDLKPHIKQVGEVLIKCKMKLGEHTEAIKIIETILKTDRSNVNLIFSKALCYLNLQNYESAILEYKHGLQLQPNNFAALNCLGLAYKNLGDLTTARDMYQRSLALNDDYSDAYCNLANVLKISGDPSSAVENYEKAIEIAKKSKGSYDIADIYVNLGSTYAAINMFDKALLNLKHSLKINPSHADALLNLGNTQLKVGKILDAVDCYSKAMSNRDNFIEAKLNFYQLVSQFQNKESIRSDYNASFQQTEMIQATHPKLQVLNAISAFISGDFGRASNCLQEHRRNDQFEQHLSRKDRQFCTAYYGFLAKLLEQLPVSKSDNSNVIFHVGESHCLSFAHHKLKFQEKSYVIKPIITYGAKAYHFSQKPENEYKAITQHNLSSIPKNSIVLVSFGEIDCRIDEGILTASVKSDASIEEIVFDTISGYLDWFFNLNKSLGHTLIFLGLPAPMYNNLYSSEQNKQISRLVKIFNACLSQKLDQLNICYVDLFASTVGLGDFSDGSYHADTRHLSPEFLKNLQSSLVQSTVSLNFEK